MDFTKVTRLLISAIHVIYRQPRNGITVSINRLILKSQLLNKLLDDLSKSRRPSWEARNGHYARVDSRMRSEWNMTTLTSSCFGNVLYKFLSSCSFCFCNQNGINQIYIASPSTPGEAITPIVEVLPPYCTDHPACTMSG